MKEIKDWEAVLEFNGKLTRAIPLPGCFIIGEIDGRRISIETDLVDLSKLIIRDTRWKLLLSRWGKAFLFGKFGELY